MGLLGEWGEVPALLRRVLDQLGYADGKQSVVLDALARVLKNQSRILDNQEKIMANQAKLDALSSSISEDVEVIATVSEALVGENAALRAEIEAVKAANPELDFSGAEAVADRIDRLAGALSAVTDPEQQSPAPEDIEVPAEPAPVEPGPGDAGQAPVPATGESSDAAATPADGLTDADFEDGSAASQPVSEVPDAGTGADGAPRQE